MPITRTHEPPGSAGVSPAPWNCSHYSTGPASREPKTGTRRRDACAPRNYAPVQGFKAQMFSGNSHRGCDQLLWLARTRDSIRDVENERAAADAQPRRAANVPEISARQETFRGVVACVVDERRDAIAAHVVGGVWPEQLSKVGAGAPRIKPPVVVSRR